MTFADLALVGALGLLGPLLALPRALRLPVVLGEFAGGVALGRTGTDTLHPTDRTFAFLAQIGFALVMFVAGSHVPARDPRLRPALGRGVVRAVAVGVLAAPTGWLISAAFDTGHVALYAVLLASSSAAIVLPVVQSLPAEGAQVLALLPQVAIADAACVVAVPLVIDLDHAGRAALGALAVLAAAGVLFVVLRVTEANGSRRRLHRLSERRGFAVELRVSLIALFALAALAVRTHVSIMLAGFSFGLAVAAVGPPRRLMKQLFAVTEGFFAPLFFVWLGASLDLRALTGRYALLGIALGVGAMAVHAAMRVLGQPLPLGLLAAAQVGVPVAAATLGTQLHLLRAGEAAALVLGAVLTIGTAALGGSLAARAQLRRQTGGASGLPPR